MSIFRIVIFTLVHTSYNIKPKQSINTENYMLYCLVPVINIRE